jgi:hypothetical protein
MASINQHALLMAMAMLAASVVLVVGVWTLLSLLRALRLREGPFLPDSTLDLRKETGTIRAFFKSRARCMMTGNRADGVRMLDSGYDDYNRSEPQQDNGRCGRASLGLC